jgi:putative hemolysin
MDDGSIAVSLLWVLVFVVLNGLFAAAEYAILRLRRTRVRELIEQGVPAAKTVDRLLRDPDRFIVTVQLGMTLAGFLAAAFSATGIALGIQSHLRRLPPDAHGVIHYFATGGGYVIVVVVTVLLALVTIVVGELIPKRVALVNPERIALRVSPFLIVFAFLAHPIVWLLAKASFYPARWFGAKPGPLEHFMSEEELRIAVEEGEHTGAIETGEREMIHSIFEFTDTMAKEVMTPRTDLDAVPVDVALSDLVHLAQETGHSRILVHGETIDDIMGFVHVKDLLGPLTEPEQAFDIGKILRKPYFVPETKMVDQLLDEFRKNNIQLAVVVDEFGGTSGIVTVEDLLEEIVGEIQDEYDEEIEILYRPIDENSAIVDARLPVDDLIEFMELDMQPEEDYETVGGLVAHLFDKVPDVGEQIAHNGIRIIVTKADETHIEEVKVERLPPEESPAAARNGD